MCKMKNTVSIDEFRTNLAQLIGKVMYAKDQVIIKKYNRDAAILLSLEEYEKLVDPAKRFSKSEWGRKFALTDKIKGRIKDIDPDILEAKITKAVQEVRAAKRNGA